MDTNNLDWNDGPPPFIGWWQASAAMDAEEWRWWDGVVWSCTATADMETSEVLESANVPNMDVGVQWTWYWPENARVPRQFPEGFGGWLHPSGVLMTKAQLQGGVHDRHPDWPAVEAAFKATVVDPVLNAAYAPAFVDPRKYGPAGKPPTNAELDAMEEDLAQQAAEEDDFDFS